MRNLTPSHLLEKHFVIRPFVKSIFINGAVVRRAWSFRVTGLSPSGTGICAECTATGHLITIEMHEIVGITGDLDCGCHLRPLILRLNSQVCWDRTNLWREKLAA